MVAGRTTVAARADHETAVEDVVKNTVLTT